MKTVKGIYAEAKIFTDDVEDYAQALVIHQNPIKALWL